MSAKRSLIVLAVFLICANTSFGKPQFQQPVLITSAGQSVDVKLAGVLLGRIGVPYEVNATATPEDLAGVKTLLIVPGYSSKGLGAAGISKEDELNRIQVLLDAAKSQGISILALHLGGNARRGIQSDDFNRIATESSSMLIIVEQGDEDGFFAEICNRLSIPEVKVANMAGAMDPLKEAIQP